jgi:hypothetical protein
VWYVAYGSNMHTARAAGLKSAETPVTGRQVLGSAHPGVRSARLGTPGYAWGMTTKDELHALVDRLQPGSLDDVAAVLRQYAVAVAEPPYPRSVGILAGAPDDLSQNADAYLAEGFGQ